MTRTHGTPMGKKPSRLGNRRHRKRAGKSYDLVDTTGDVVGIIDAMGVETAVIIGHDWGAIVAWNSLCYSSQEKRIM